MLRLPLAEGERKEEWDRLKAPTQPKFASSEAKANSILPTSKIWYELQQRGARPN